VSPHPQVAYKVLSSNEFTQWQDDGTFTGSPVDLADGFIHLSTVDQMSETLQKHFIGQPGLVIATIDLALLGDAVRWEPSRGGALFPHVYGDMPIAAMTGFERLPFAITE
jgi:beta-hydroxylase